MKYLYFSVAVLLCVVTYTGVKGQSIYHLDIGNGLPTNYVYNLLPDKHEYLWISTPKGILRYNGYELKLFNFATGMHKEDVWRTYEDKKGRIWLSSISRQIGYIYRSSSFRMAVNPLGSLLYPININEYDSGIYFITYNSHTFHIELHDTIRQVNIPKDIQKWFPRSGNEILFVRHDSIWNARLSFNNVLVDFNAISYIMPDTTDKNIIYRYVIGKYIISYRKGDAYIWIKDLERKTDSLADFRKMAHTTEVIQRIFPFNDSYFRQQEYMLVADNRLYLLDSTLSLQRVVTFDSLLQEFGGTNVSFYTHDSLWHEVLSSYTNGVFIYNGRTNHFIPAALPDLKDYNYLGNDALLQHYWWNDKTKLLLRIGKLGGITIKKYENFSRLEKITVYNNDSSLLSGWTSISKIDNHNMGVSNYLDDFNKIITNHSIAFWNNRKLFEIQKMVITEKKMYGLNSGGVCEFTKTGRNLRVNFFDYQRFDDIVYDSLRDWLLLYSSDYVEVYKEGKPRLTIPTHVLKSLKIKTIEKIIIENRYGNIFLKDYDRLLVLDNDLHMYCLFEHYALNGAIVKIRNDMLVAAGKFGILFSKIQGRCKLTLPVVYRNVKNSFYNNVSDIQVGEDSVLLKTDKNAYYVAIPRDSVFNLPEQQETPFKLLCYYNDNITDICTDDTLKMLQSNRRLQFDIINPEGNGLPEYQYKLWNAGPQPVKLGENDIMLPDKLLPGRYYRLSVSIGDNVWHSAPVTFYIYNIPYWWQKPLGKMCIWTAAITLLLLFGFMVAKVTRKIVVQKNERKNAQLEMELKAIYSQINPHFIYNTLNSALLLIHKHKMEEAYSHVSKFSRLLRAYVKSSRNKYITLDEEIANLKNYIELQQTRFKNKFDYSIIVDEQIDTSQVSVPTLLLQPFVENAINHGLLQKKEAGRLNITFRMTSAYNIICIIEDDGIGREQSQLLNNQSEKQHESFGNAMIKDLVKIYNRYEKIKIEINITDKAFPLSGTIVAIHIKRQHHE